MSGRNVVFEHYNAAKKALGRGNHVCQLAEELAKQTQSNLAKVATLVTQISFLRSAIYDQLQVLRTVATQINAEESKMKVDLVVVLKDLDARDHDLNAILGTLRTTRLPAQLEAQLQQGDPHARDASPRPARTLFDFAHDEAVESLKGQLRQSIDDMQEVQENMIHYREHFNSRLGELEIVWNNLPNAPSLSRPERGAGNAHAPIISKQQSQQGQASSMSAIIRSYTRSQEEHLGEMAKLLLSLTEHFDHASKLFQANSSMPLEEVEELQAIVDNDSQQVDDVLLELDDRAIDMEEDVSHVKAHVAECTSVQMKLISGFRSFENLDAEDLRASLTKLESERARIHAQLGILKEQLIGLADHYRAFAHSYDALLLEIHRRREYESTIEGLRKQAEQAIARLAEHEAAKREHFILCHGNSLPEDIWTGIRARPVAHEISFQDAVHQSPKLPESLIAATMAKLARH